MKHVRTLAARIKRGIAMMAKDLKEKRDAAPIIYNKIIFVCGLILDWGLFPLFEVAYPYSTYIFHDHKNKTFELIFALPST